MVFSPNHSQNLFFVVQFMSGCAVKKYYIYLPTYTYIYMIILSHKNYRGDNFDTKHKGIKTYEFEADR